MKESIVLSELILIRHGEGEHQTKLFTGGWTDSKLTETGKNQAIKTSEKILYIVQDKPISIYSSDLSRALQTAEYVSLNLNETLKITSELREINNGDAANLTLKEANKIKQPISHPILDWEPYPNSESWRMLQIRANTFLDKIKVQNISETAVIISHANMIVCLINSWLKLPIELSDKITYEINNCSITILSTHEPFGEKIIKKLNDTCHLD